MNIRKEIILEVFTVLVEHFQYSVSDINSYEELTAKEKEIISKEIFNILKK